ncbi:MAG: pyruvate kinase, partial [Lysobacterales bacterium]
MTTRPDEKNVARLLALSRDLDELRRAMIEFESRHAQVLSNIGAHRTSAKNLLHYLAMRKRDLRSLQTELATLGLSSIGRAEAHALSAVNAVRNVVRQLAKQEIHELHDEAPCDLASGASLLDAHTAALLGPEPTDRSVHIMVTMPSEAASDYTVVERLLANGMTCMRINCAHDEPREWLKMIEHLQHARAALNRQCTVLMDLGGPKLRTGDVEPGAAVRKLRPSRDAYGRVTAPARVWLTSRETPAPPPSPADGALRVDTDWLAAIDHGDEVTFYDTRRRHRRLAIVDRDRGGLWGELTRTAYVTNGTRLQRCTCQDEQAFLT